MGVPSDFSPVQPVDRLSGVGRDVSQCADDNRVALALHAGASALGGPVYGEAALLSRQGTESRERLTMRHDDEDDDERRELVGAARWGGY